MGDSFDLLPDEFQINPSRPIYEQFVEQIQGRIVGGLIPTGSRLPSVREFAGERRVNPTTIARTYQELERMGLIVTYRGQGTYVTQEEAVIHRARRTLAKVAIRQLKDVAQSLGLSIEQLYQLGDEED